MRKSHPVRRAVLATAATVSGIVLLLSLKPASDPGSAEAAGGAPPAAESVQGGARPIGDGTVTGDAVQTQYGAVQVRLTVSGGRITKAEAVQAPKGGQSDQITSNAVPRLNQAAVQTQSGDIDAVSGATYTSAGYKESLQSALDKARASAPADTGAATRPRRRPSPATPRRPSTARSRYGSPSAAARSPRPRLSRPPRAARATRSPPTPCRS